MGVEERLAALTEAWIKADPRWANFQRGCGKGWDIRFREMPDGVDEAIDWRNKIMTLAMFRWPQPKMRAAHTVCHVLLHHCAEMLTEAMCHEADEAAAFWMLVSADGEPMIAA